MVSDTLKTSFLKNVKKLQESISIDYHPMSNNQVVDIVHPSMFCYVKSVTKCNIPVDKKIIFQWLPTDVKIKSNKVKFQSYINNLDYDTNRGLYKDIEQIFGLFVPNSNTFCKH